MKRILAVALLAIMAFVAVAVAQETKATEAAKPAATAAKAAPAEAAKTATFTGEVIDLSCFMDHGASGAEHAKCAMGCIKKGMPVGFLTTDGIMYVLLGQGHESANAQVADFAGKKATITGTAKEDKGLKTIMVSSIAEAK